MDIRSASVGICFLGIINRNVEMYLYFSFELPWL